MIISGGVNIYPQEAENVLIGHPKVVDVAVFGVPNEDFGEEVKAVVQPVDMADAGPELERELIAYCRVAAGRREVPPLVDFRDELPRHPTGKLYKRLLKDEYWAGPRPEPDHLSAGDGRGAPSGSPVEDDDAELGHLPHGVVRALAGVAASRARRRRASGRPATSAPR